MKRGPLKLVFALVILMGIFFAFRPRALDVEVTQPRRGEFIETLKVDGYLRSKIRYTVPAFADGDIRRVGLEVGDPIRKGDIITRIYWDVSWDALRSPISGVVSKVFRESAGPVRRGDPIIEIIDPDHLEIIAEMLTTDAARLSVGSRVVVSSWGGEPPFEARVSRISKAGYVKHSALGVEEEVTEVIMEPQNIPAEASSHLGSTFHVEMEIELSRVKDALTVSSGALFRNAESWAVFEIQNKKAKRVEVTIGARSGQETQVIEGLDEGSQVILFPGDRIQEGTRVQSLSKSGN